MYANPLAGGTLARNSVSASSPPAEAPRPTTRVGAVSEFMAEVGVLAPAHAGDWHIPYADNGARAAAALQPNDGTYATTCGFLLGRA